MVVTVHLHTILQRPSDDGWQRRLELDLLPGSTVADVMARLEVTLSPDALLLLVNGRHAEPETVLHAADDVHLIPALSGG
jgi:molybdopterin converting factor small subunit